jgi:hypothetical protein
MNPNPVRLSRGGDRNQSGNAKRGTSPRGKWFWSDYTVSNRLRANGNSRIAPLIAGVAAYRQSDGAAIQGSSTFAVAAPASK